MNKQEILHQIKKTIKGQGSAVDVGGKLAAILESIVDLIPEDSGGGIVDLPFSSTGLGPEWEEVKGVNMLDLINAYAIRCSDGKVLGTKMVANAMTELTDAVGRTVTAVFGSCAVSDVLEAAELIVFSDEEGILKARIYSL